MINCNEFNAKTKVLLIDDNYEHLMGIKELISLENDIDVVAAATNANIALNLIKKYQPEIVITDMNMPEKDGLTAIQEIKKVNTDIKIIALTAYDDSDLIFRAMKLGAKSYILKTMASSQLIRAIHEVVQGKIYLPQGLVTGFFEYFQQSFKESTKVDIPSYLDELTYREEEVLDMLTQGHNYKDVANLLYISETTVKTHVNNIFQKLQVNDRTQAVLYALNHGFVSKRKQKSLVS
ncbi:response regulator transcription factor [bacterium]|nr:response regulator transcription factor [bacterium]